MEEKKLNIYQKLQKCRVDLQKKNLKKSGENKFANFKYYQLEDFIPTVNEMFNNIGLFSNFSILEDTAKLTITDTDVLTTIVFESPTAEANIKGCSPIQSLGGIHTYMKRYLYQNALEIVEDDMLDAQNLKEEKPIVLATTEQKTIIMDKYKYEEIVKMLERLKIDSVDKLTLDQASKMIAARK